MGNWLSNLQEKEMKKNLVYLLTLICLWGCESLNPFENDGDYTTIRHDFPTLSHIENLNIFEIVLVQDLSDFLILKGGEKKLSEVVVEYEDGKVLLDHNYKNDTRNFEKIKAEFHFRDLSSLILNSAVKVSCIDTIVDDQFDIQVTFAAELIELDLNLRVNSLLFHSKGIPSGGYQFSGTCKNAKYIMNGITNINATQFKTESVTIAQNSVGNANIWVTNTLNVTTYNSGNVYYKGSPDISIKRIKINNQELTGEVLPLINN
jgi:hypothetical protein